MTAAGESVMRSGGDAAAPCPPLPATLGELAALVGGELGGIGFGGDGQAGAAALPVIRGIHTVDQAGADEITWVGDQKHARGLSTSKAAAVLTTRELAAGAPMPAILVADVEAAAARVLARFETPQTRPAPGVNPTAVVAASAMLGPGCAVGPNVNVGERTAIGAGTVLHAGACVGADCRIGDGCELWPNTYVADRCVLGSRVVLKPGAVIGSDGFGFMFRDGRHQRIPQIGIVELEDDVEVGANSCIDRAKVGRTIIGRGTKIDNLVQVAHNCRVGPACILVAQVGLSGSVRLGSGVVMAGQAGVTPGVQVGDGARVGVQAAVIRDLEGGREYLGWPARPSTIVQRERVAAQRLPDLLNRVQELARRVAELEAAVHDRKTG